MEPTAHEDVNAAVGELLRGSQAILGDRFLGMYLDGSLALGDFDPHSSDIDFVVATESAVSAEQFAALRAMHAGFNAGTSPWAADVEAWYMPRQALRRYDPAGTRQPHIQRGPQESLVMDTPESDWVLHLYVLREHGVTLVGPDVRSLIDPIPPDGLRRAVAELMEIWWGPMADSPAPKFQGHVGYQAYTVMTMCRALYTLHHGTIVSKPVAARWALTALDPRLTDLIALALAWRKDDSTARAGSVSDTTTLIRLALARCRQWLLTHDDHG